ncbi:hypothetical protein ACPWSR_13105 [Alloiococcus sp. CFN-8]|uniref:hypothetical protein n=1 Tax=Alloiococcus sp. CFN-8 TaxID=3416081 RepID=UPI003CEF566E
MIIFIKKFINVFKHIASVILAIILLNFFNLFNYASFIPKSIRFETGLTAYVTVLESIFTITIDKISNKLLTEIHCIFYGYGNEKDISNTPDVYFNNELGICEIRLNLEAKGSARILSQNQIKISFPDWVDIQSGHKNSVLSIGNNHDCIVSIEKLLPYKSNREEKISTDIKIALIKSEVDEDRVINVQAELVTKKGIIGKVMCKYTSNSFRLINRLGGS